MDKRHFVAIAVLCLVSAQLTPHIFGRESTGPVSMIVSGGAVHGVAFVDKDLFVAVGNDVLQYSAGSDVLRERLSFTAPPRWIAASSGLLAALVESELHIVELGDKHHYRVPSGLLPDQRRINGLQVDGTMVYVTTADGIVRAIEYSGQGLASLLYEYNWSDILGGSWQLNASTVVMEGGTLFAIISDRSDYRRSKVVSIGRDDNGVWISSVITTLERAGQPFDLDVRDGVAYLAVGHRVVAIDVSSGAIVSQSVDNDAWTLQSIATSHNRLFALALEPLTPTEYEVRLHTYDVMDPTTPTEVRISTVVPKGYWKLTGFLYSADDWLFVVGSDSLQVYDTSKDDIDGQGRNSIVTLSASAAVSDETISGVLAARYQSICGFTAHLEERKWCIDIGFTASKLLAVEDTIVGLSRGEGLITVRFQDEVPVVADRLAPDTSYSKYVDVDSAPDGFVALLDENLPRADPTQFRLDLVAVGEDGAMHISRSLDIKSESDCRVPRIAVNGSWLGFLCGASVLEFALAPTSIVYRSKYDLPLSGTAISTESGGSVAVATSRGIAVFETDSVDPAILLESPAGVSSEVIAVSTSGRNIEAIQGDPATGSRAVVKYVETQPGVHGALALFLFTETRPSFTAQIFPYRDGIGVVSESGALMLFLRSQRSELLFLPLLPNTTGHRSSP